MLAYDFLLIIVYYLERLPYKIGLVNVDFVESHYDLSTTVDRTLKFHSHIARNPIE